MSGTHRSATTTVSTSSEGGGRRTRMLMTAGVLLGTLMLAMAGVLMGASFDARELDAVQWPHSGTWSPRDHGPVTVESGPVTARPESIADGSDPDTSGPSVPGT
ncbi:MAG: hypothetical protein HOQ38_19575, partial [Nonomuraea sp.]|nr:hypothetical protein [Nonomuraea sp.]